MKGTIAYTRKWAGAASFAHVELGAAVTRHDLHLPPGIGSRSRKFNFMLSPLDRLEEWISRRWAGGHRRGPHQLGIVHVKVRQCPARHLANLRDHRRRRREWKLSQVIQSTRSVRCRGAWHRNPMSAAPCGRARCRWDSSRGTGQSRCQSTRPHEAACGFCGWSARYMHGDTEPPMSVAACRFLLECRNFTRSSSMDSAPAAPQGQPLLGTRHFARRPGLPNH